jgi:hypothetical protein
VLSKNQMLILENTGDEPLVVIIVKANSFPVDSSTVKHKGN